MTDQGGEETGPALDERGRPVPRLPEHSPDWMARAFADAPDLWHLEVDGARIEVRQWGDAAAPPLLLVHGLGAHADWWRFIAPLLAERHRVVAPSLSGMGGSDWREGYGVGQHAREIAALAAQLSPHGGGRAGGVTLVAHSHGSIVSLAAARLAGPAIGRMALIDFYLPPLSIAPRTHPARDIRRFATLAEAVARFRPSPPQACANPALLAYIASRTVRFVDGAQPCWSWVTDPRIMVPIDHAAARRDLAAVTCPLLILFGERSALVDAAVVAHIRETAPGHARFAVIPDADHHVPLDQPLALVSALRTMLALD